MPRSTSLTVARIRIQIEIAAVIIPSTVSSLRGSAAHLLFMALLHACVQIAAVTYVLRKGTGSEGCFNTLPPLASEFVVCHGSLGIYAAFDRPLYRK